MRTIERRVAALETDLLPQGGWDWRKPTHAIHVHEGQSDTDALRAYIAKQPDRPVEADHNAIWILFVSPMFDADDNRIFLKANETRHGEGRELSEVLAELEAA